MEVTADSLKNINSVFIWNISGFPCKWKKIEKFIESPSFTIGDISADKIEWKLQIWETKKANKSFISLYLKSKFLNDTDELTLAYKFYLWNNKMNTEIFYLSKFSKLNNNWGLEDFLETDGDELKNHLALSTDSTLSIVCCINTYNNGILYPNVEMIKDYNSFFLSDNLSDVTIEIGMKKLNAHKIILSASSKVFKAMFSHKMRESSDNVISITDVTYDAMKEVLRFIYCGQVKKLDLLNKDLLAAADKYDINLLKRICEENLVKNLSVSNACEILNIANLYTDTDDLKERVIAFVIQNMRALIDNDELKKIIDANLFIDILRQVSCELE